MKLNISKWITTVNDAMIKYAKIKGYKYYYDLYFRLNVIIDNNIHIIDTYILNDNDDLIVDLKLT